jgi:hypothetical protein
MFKSYYLKSAVKSAFVNPSASSFDSAHNSLTNVVRDSTSAIELMFV